MAGQRDVLLGPPAEGQDSPLGDECLGQDFGERQSLGDLDGLLDALVGQPQVALQPVKAPELRGQRGQVLVGVVGDQDLERLLHPLDGRVEPAPGELLDLAEPGRDASRRMGQALRSEGRDGPLVVGPRGVGSARRPRHAARSLVQLGVANGILGELDGVFEVPLSLRARGQ